MKKKKNNTRHMAWKNRDQNKIQVPEGVKNQGDYKNLMNQINKIARHNRAGSFKTRDRYYQAVDRFVRYLADKFKLEKFANISAKHLVSYVEEMQSQGKSASTVKNELSAIRFFHDKTEKVRYNLPSNADLKEKYGVTLEKRNFGGVDRAWSENEFNGMVKHAQELGRHDIADMMYLARYQGLRIHEVTRLGRADAEKALRDNTLTVKGKGGRVRTIPLAPECRFILFNAMQNVERGQKLFIPEGKGAHEVIGSVQTFINYHRDDFTEVDRVSNLTFHGLRHTRARELYEELIEEGVNKEAARYEVAEYLGHSREDVTRIYLAK